ncbi:MAG: hypothetical protein JO033_16520 [Acidobacteriaceae bacterium]|nr:hypothetical protein [Acidobacteriaceae bacterium]
MQSFVRQMMSHFIVVGLSAVTTIFAASTAGTLDPTFGSGGVATVNGAGAARALVTLQADGRILVLAAGVGESNLIRFTSTGALDPSFGVNGVAALSPPVGGSIMLQPNGQIVIAGLITNPTTGVSELGVERLDTDGSLDKSFGNAGLATASLQNRVPSGSGLTVLIESNGDILAGTQLFPTGRRQPTQTLLARFTPAGVPDNMFANGGVLIATLSSGCTGLAELSSGDIIVIDFFEVAQIAPNGTVRSSVTGGVMIASNTDSLDGAPNAFQPNGDYLAADALFVGEESRGHDSSVQVFRFTQTGTADTSFADPSFHFEGPGGSGIETYLAQWPCRRTGTLWLWAARLRLPRAVLQPSVG